MIRRSLALLTVLSAAGCASYSTEGDIHAIYQEIGTVNGVHREAAIADALKAAGATPFQETEEVAAVPEEADRCGSGLPASTPNSTITLQATSTTPTSEPATFLVDCAALRGFAFGAASIDAKASSGETVVLVASRTHANDRVVLARKSDGRTVVIQPSENIVETRKIRRPGTCNGMPSPPVMERQVMFFVLKGRTTADVDVVNTPYRALGTETICDETVE
jgi:hypothetical protein